MGQRQSLEESLKYEYGEQRARQTVKTEYSVERAWKERGMVQWYQIGQGTRKGTSLVIFKKQHQQEGKSQQT